LYSCHAAPRALHSFPTRRSSDLVRRHVCGCGTMPLGSPPPPPQPFVDVIATSNESRTRGVTRRGFSAGRAPTRQTAAPRPALKRSEEHTSELQSREISYAVFCLK